MAVQVKPEFTNNLTTQELSLHKKLAQVSNQTLWGLAIHKVLQDPSTERFRDLLAQLSSQAKDQPEVMADILGQELMIEMLGYVTPIF